jgi:hypothetical protein
VPANLRFINPTLLGRVPGVLPAGKPLRGRQTRNLRIDPFGYRESAELWGLAGNPDAAFWLHALIGGTPAYRRFADGEAPGEETSIGGR